MNYNRQNEYASNYGIINVSVANMRLQPIYQAELVNQLILGTIVPIFEEQNDFYYIQNWDGYFGWINKHALIVRDKKIAQKWQSGKRVIVLENFGVVRKNENIESQVITDLVPCAILKWLDSHLKLTKVELPDGQTGFIETRIIVDEVNQLKVNATREGIVNVSKKYLGVPYLWGGTSARGFDCSGFVQTVFRLLNVKLPRDANRMAEIGEEIPLKKSLDDLYVGDLLFFGKTLRRITHVAISLGQGLFIHSEGCVQINSLDPAHPMSNDYRIKTLLKAKRIL